MPLSKSLTKSDIFLLPANGPNSKAWVEIVPLKKNLLRLDSEAADLQQISEGSDSVLRYNVATVGPFSVILPVWTSTLTMLLLYESWFWSNYWSWRFDATIRQQSMIALNILLMKTKIYSKYSGQQIFSLTHCLLFRNQRIKGNGISSLRYQSQLFIQARL